MEGRRRARGWREKESGREGEAGDGGEEGVWNGGLEERKLPANRREIGGGARTENDLAWRLSQPICQVFKATFRIEY